MSRFNSFVAMSLFLLVLIPVSGKAETSNDYYFTIGVGPQLRERGYDSAGSTSFDAGFGLGGALGFHVPGNFRAEFEGAYFYNNADTLRPAGAAETKADGYVDVTALFGNLYYDIPIDKSRFTPYLGLGLGSYKVAVRGLTNDLLRTFPLAITADSDWALAWQARVGTSITLKKNLDMLVGYRYFHGNEMDLVNPVGEILHPNVRLHNLEFGIRYNF